MPFWRLYYHAVWATKNREPVILDSMVDPITRGIEETTRGLGVTVFVVGVMPDHIHVLAQIPPSLTVAAVIGRWKGSSSHAANEHRPRGAVKLAWQEGYGVFDVSQSGFGQAKDYVLHQRERHANRDLYGIPSEALTSLSRSRRDASSDAISGWTTTTGARNWPGSPGFRGLAGSRVL